MRKALITITTVALLYGTISCAKKEKPPEEPAYPIRIVVIDGVEVLISPDYPRDGRVAYSFEEELSIGVEEGDEFYQLYRPHDIKVAENGDIYVIDWREDHLRVYDNEGKYLRTLAQKGRGPGEFESPASFDFLSDGRIVLLDGRNRQVSIIGKDDVYQSGFKVEGYCKNLIVDGQDQLYMEKTMLKEVEVIGITQIIENKMNIYCSGLDGRLLHDYGVYRGIKMNYTRTRQGSMSSSSPYSHTTVWTVDEEGKLYIGYNEKYRLDVYDPDGELVFGFGRDFTPIKHEDFRGGISPEFWSAFYQHLIFDNESNLWLWHQTGGEEHEGYLYDIFSPSGIYVKQAVVPHKIHRIKNGKAYCIIRNEDEFFFIKRYKLIR
jgi:hypothetical protein